MAASLSLWDLAAEKAREGPKRIGAGIDIGDENFAKGVVIEFIKENDWLMYVYFKSRFLDEKIREETHLILFGSKNSASTHLCSFYSLSFLQGFFNQNYHSTN